MPQSKPCACCPTDLQWIRKKVKTRLSWVLVMVLLGTCDVFINWVNFADIVSPEHDRGLVLGPPPRHMQILLLTFTIIGSVLYIPETLNTFSVFFCDGNTKVPILYEQLIVLPAESIPLSAINFFICKCRRYYGSTIQTLCATTTIVFVFIRIVWYAHMEGKLLQRKGDEVKMKKGLFMAVCALYACSMAFPITTWRSQPATTLQEKDQVHVSVYLLKSHFLENRVLDDYTVDLILQSHGRDVYNPQLIESIEDIVDAGDEGKFAKYKCDHNATFLPAECLSTDGYLLFRFIYAPYTEAGPFGEIVFNYAFVHSISDEKAAQMGKNFTKCVPSTKELTDGWRLFYLNHVAKTHMGVEHHFVSTPWSGTCTTPVPWFDTSIPICPESMTSTPSPARVSTTLSKPAFEFLKSQPSNQTSKHANSINSMKSDDKS